MSPTWLSCAPDTHRRILAHLLPPRPHAEEAAFAFARVQRNDEGTAFHILEWFAVPEDGFAIQTMGQIELADHIRPLVIKRAHDLSASLIEFHSHPYPDLPAQFSASDMAGFGEFVPHVWWRLRGAPYAAVVVAPQGFDALVWVDDPMRPVALTHLAVGNRKLRPTHLTLSKRRFSHG